MNHKYAVVIGSSIGGLLEETTLAFHKITPGEKSTGARFERLDWR
jgi:hypothetical protein